MNKILPEGSADDIAKTLRKDQDNFNNLDYDIIVKAMTDVLLLADKLFPFARRRADEVGNLSKHFSEVRGVHEQVFDAEAKRKLRHEFNDQIDMIREDRTLYWGRRECRHDE